MKDLSRALPAAACAGVFLLNAICCWELFQVEFLAHMASIEGAYIGLSRYIATHFTELSWFPLWYGGIPFQNAYPPLLHHGVALLAWLSGLSFARAFHVASAIIYCAGPATFFLLAHRLSARLGRSFAAAVVYSLLSPSAFLMPSIAGDLGGLWGSRKLLNVARYGDAPHLAALALLPLALLALDHVWERFHPARFVIAACAFAAVALTNWLGAFALALATTAYLLARAGEPRWRVAWLRAGLLALFAYGLACPWIPPSTILAVRRNSEIVRGVFPLGWAQVGYAAAATAVALLLWWVLRRRRAGPGLRFSVLFLWLVGVIVLSAEWAGIVFVPQPDRYHVELEWALCFLVAMIPWPVLPRRRGFPGILFVAGLSAALLAFVSVRRQAALLLRPIDIHQTIEYRVADWFQHHLPGTRIYSLGSVQFWLNAFADNPQLGGGFAQGITNPMIHAVHYGIHFASGEGQMAAAWLRLFGVGAVVVSGPAGRDAYREGWRDPDKFRGNLPELFREGDDAIFGVPQRSSSLAYVIDSHHLPPRVPYNILDLEPVAPLIQALDDPALPAATTRWLNPHTAAITASLNRGQLLFVQISYHAGWSASVAGRNCPVRPNALGLITLEPDCEGECEVLLRYDGGWEMKVARVVASICLLGALVGLLGPWRRGSWFTGPSAPS